MTLTFTEVKDKKEWDSFVQSQERYSFVQSYKYLSVLEELTEEIIPMGVYSGDALVALLPMGVIKARRGNYLRLRHGPIWGEDFRNTDTLVGEVIDYLRTFANQNALSFVRIQPMQIETGNLEQNGFRSAPTHNLDAQHTLQLELGDRAEDEVFFAMRKNTRYYIRKAEKEGIEVIEDITDFESFFQILRKTAQRQNYTTWPRSYFERVFNEFSVDGLHLYFATYKNKKVAIGLFLDYGKYRFYLEGGMLTNFSKKYPSYAIQGRSIRDAIKGNTEVYDFWGGVSPKGSDGKVVQSYPWAGIDLFKRGFGGEEKSIMHPHDLPLSWKYSVTWAIEYIEKMKRGY
ncbi:peptidoglycan bridge formation glycyltransferase FemA/FemB family protein [Candidatus Dojkabacteria bacterium]|uniref:Peptidoglycan bridge formation glycyltransferase FemA/FemB family protein n=1 Tax=Candidatus Dojkabacteria bacterium TaxID=2099670 RepID=A0A955L9H6_9BACT|nr:peptidoglycan bridge formation glycyltransferase FemA/FemB family protein [Candidatus Dojkabacteria bacterium]